MSAAENTEDFSPCWIGDCPEASLASPFICNHTVTLTKRFPSVKRLFYEIHAAALQCREVQFGNWPKHSYTWADFFSAGCWGGDFLRVATCAISNVASQMNNCWVECVAFALASNPGTMQNYP